VDKYHARFAVNLRGLQSVADGLLRSKLALDLLQHVRDSVPGGLEKLEAALLEDPQANLQPLQDLQEALQRQGISAEEQLRDVERAFRSFPDSQLCVDVFPKKKASMMREMTAQLQNSNDLSLSLLLTLLLVLGKRGDGVIRATGKYVPRLLREVQAAGIVTQAQIQLLSTVKAAAVGKGSVSDEEIEELKRIGKEI